MLEQKSMKLKTKISGENATKSWFFEKGVEGNFRMISVCLWALIMVIVSRVYTYPQTHQIVYIKYLQFFTGQPYHNKVVF